MPAAPIPRVALPSAPVRPDGAGDLELDFLTSLFAELSGLPPTSRAGRRRGAGSAAAGSGERGGAPQRG